MSFEISCHLFSIAAGIGTCALMITLVVFSFKASVEANELKHSVLVRTMLTTSSIIFASVSSILVIATGFVIYRSILRITRIIYKTAVEQVKAEMGIPLESVETE